MSRHGVMQGAVAAILLLSSGPGYAGCRESAACGPQLTVSPQPFFMPPVAALQIETDSSPIAAPPPASASDASAGGAAEPGGPFSLADLNHGTDAWATIEPDTASDHRPDQPLTAVAKVVPARRARPLPPKLVQEIAPHLMIELPVRITSATVPGIDDATSGSGNRALWFAQDER